MESSDRSSQQELDALIRAAQASLADAIILIERLPEEAFGAPGKGYLLAKLDIACNLLEEEIPEFQQAQHLNLLNALGMVNGSTEVPGSDSVSEDGTGS
jgi:hypothetical protein